MRYIAARVTGGQTQNNVNDRLYSRRQEVHSPTIYMVTIATVLGLFQGGYSPAIPLT